MSGIVGMLNLNDYASALTSENAGDIEKAMEVQKHRGTGRKEVCAFRINGTKEVTLSEEVLGYVSGKKYDGMLGVNCMETTDISYMARTLFVSDDESMILAFDGELYNNVELRLLLEERGYCFKDGTKEEILYYLLCEYGIESAISRLNGMFAIVIVDLKHRRYFFTRDRLGIKPLYYSISQNQILCASELKCFTCFSQFERRLDYDAFNARLIFSRPSDKVLLKDVEMVNPGEYVVASMNGGVVSKKYFDINLYERQNQYVSMQDALLDLDDILESAIKRQLRIDIPYAVQISGGVDSTLVSHYIKKIVSNKGLQGISIVDGLGDKGEEFWINKVANAFDIQLHKYEVENSFFEENYSNLIWHNDAPIYKPYFSSYYKMANSSKDFAKVIFCGEGVDEIAGGYNRFTAGVYQPFFTRNHVDSELIKSYSNYAEYAVGTDCPIRDFSILGYDNLKELIEEQMSLFSMFSGSNFTKQLKYETYCRLPESFMRQEKMASANSVEVRVPLVDNEVLDFVMQLPENMLMAFGAKSPVELSDNPLEWVQGKYIFKELCAKVLGNEFAYRKKHTMVFDERGMLKSEGFKNVFYEEVLPLMKKRGLLDYERIENWYKNLAHINQSEFNVMWRAIGLETWCQLFLD